MKEVIDCLDRYFNLFAFEGDMAINMESVDQISIDRISRIINYIYQNYSEKIRLEELASMEHLSMFYVSHIIKNCTGKISGNSFVSQGQNDLRSSFWTPTKDQSDRQRSWLFHYRLL